MLDYLVVGSGAGGATLAKELTSVGKKVLILEQGPESKINKANRTYSIIQSAVEIWSTACVGGTTKVTMGNAVRANYLNNALDEYYDSAEEELGVVEVPETHIGQATRNLLHCSDDWNRMPKAIDFSKCKKCGRCPFGCPTGARWDASTYINDAVRNGAKILPSTEVKRILMENGQVRGVEVSDGRQFESRSVILCAGAIETPRILMRSGIDNVGNGLFVDTFITVGGLKKDVGLNRELGMALFIKRKGYLLSPHYSGFLMPYLSSKGFVARPDDVLGLMVKIEDAPTGKVLLNDTIKTITKKDSRLLEQGKEEAKKILMETGVDEKTIVSTYYRGTHPGGTCSRIIGKSYETGFEGLHISDASVIQGPFGLPPMLTIIAIAKNVSSMLLGRA